MRAREIRHLIFFRTAFKGWVRRVAPIFVLLIGLQQNAEGFVTLSPSLALSERYTDNFYFTEIEASREGDFTTMVGPQLTVAGNGRNWNMSARYEGDAEFNVRHPDENWYGQTLAMELNLPSVLEQVRGLDLHITESVAYVPELPAFSFGQEMGALPPEANQGIQVGRINTFRNRTGINLGYGWTPLFSTALSYSYLITRYHGGNLEDYVVHEGDLSGIYHASRRMQWTVTYSASVTDYERADSVAIHSMNVGNLYQISPSFTINVGAGAAYIPSDSTQWTLNGELRKTGPLGTLSLQYLRGIGTGGGVIATPTLSQNLMAQATRVLGRSASASVLLGYALNDALSGSSLKISTQEIGTGFQMNLLSWLSGGINYFYLNQRTEGGASIQDARRNLVMVTLTAATLPLRMMQ